MKDICGGNIINSTFYGTHIEKENVDFRIDVNQHQAVINFERKFVLNEIDENDKKYLCYDHLFLENLNGDKITLLGCDLIKCSEKQFEIDFEILIVGNYIEQLQVLEPSNISFEIGSWPIPLLNMHLPKEKTVLVCAHVEIQVQKCKNGSHNVELLITPVNKGLSVDELEDVFFKILDIFILCLGFYPYIAAENILYKIENMKIYHSQFFRYKAGGSYAHWSTILVSKSNMILSQSYSIFNTIVSENDFIIKVITNAIHSRDAIIDITLSTLIQCVEGYMRKWHPILKFSNKLKKDICDTMINSFDNLELLDTENPINKVSKFTIRQSIKGLLGHLNEPSLGECLKAAFDTNKYTQMILKHQVEDHKYDVFINKSKATRNQFSHMIPQEEGFKDVYEVIMAKDKYILLLRLLVLNDLGIQINGDVKRYIDGIDEAYVKYD